MFCPCISGWWPPIRSDLNIFLFLKFIGMERRTSERAHGSINWIIHQEGWKWTRLLRESWIRGVGGLYTVLLLGRWMGRGEWCFGTAVRWNIVCGMLVVSYHIIRFVWQVGNIVVYHRRCCARLDVSHSVGYRTMRDDIVQILTCAVA